MTISNDFMGSISLAGRLLYHDLVAISAIEFSRRDAKKLSSRTLSKIQSRMRRDGAIAFDNLLPMRLLKKLRLNVERRDRSGELRKNGLVRDIGGRYAAVLP